jgi:hypothetical protein
MKDISDYTTAELEVELYRRRCITPEELYDFDFTEVTKYVRKLIAGYAEHGSWQEDDWDETLVRLVFEAMYGNGIFDWIRNRRDE